MFSSEAGMLPLALTVRAFGQQKRQRLCQVQIHTHCEQTALSSYEADGEGALCGWVSAVGLVWGLLAPQ